MRHNKDILWKGLLEWVCDDLLRFVFPEADRIFDMQKGFTFLDKELAEMYPEPEKEIDVRHVDKLVKVFRKDGDEEWLLIHIEVQHRTDAKDRPFFSERMFRYFCLCFNHHRKPVVAMAIFTGPDAKRLPDSYEYELLNTRLRYEYNTLCILDYSDEELGKSDNPFAWVVLAAKKALLKGKDMDKKLLEGKLFIFRKLYENGIFEKRKLQAILTFLDNYVRFENPENNRKFRSEIDNITGKRDTMDIFDQVAEMKRQEGVQETSRLVVENLLKQSDFSMEKIASVANVSLEFVKEVKKNLKKK